MTLPSWAGEYVGIPFCDLGRDRDGADCWGLVRMVLHEQAAVDLPCWATDYRSEADHERVAASINDARDGGDWMSVPPGSERGLDVVQMLLAIKGDGRWRWEPLHVGIVVCPGRVLHVEAGTGARISGYRDDRSFRSRVHAFWRHRRLAG